jgi:hypothetical protein
MRETEVNLLRNNRLANPSSISNISNLVYPQLGKVNSQTNTSPSTPPR